MENHPIIDIIMTTYNHEDYVAMAIESVLCQQINMPFRLIIGEDCSTDKTYLICQEYALKYPDRITLLQNDKNLGLIKNYKRCFEASQAKYIAILEGDDYWTDQNKIAKQIEILESDSQIGLVYANYRIFNERNHQLIQVPKKVVKRCLANQGYIYINLIKQNLICAMTVMLRRSLLENIDYAFLIANNYRTIDYHLWLTCSVSSKIKYIPDIAGVYTVSGHSISNNTKFESRAQFASTKRDIIKYFLSQYPVKGYSAEDVDNEFNMALLMRAIKTSDLKNTKKYLRKFSIKGVYSIILKSTIYMQ